MPTTTREIHLAARPAGWPSEDDFAVVTTELPDPAQGQALVRNVYMSVDPYMRPRMNDVKSYVPPFQVGKPLDGAAIGEVLESRVDGLTAGDLVLHGLGWREHAVVTRPRKLTPVEGVAVSHYLGALGTTGLTAYVGLLDIAGFRPGDTVFVSGAAGAVGSVAGQIARLKGAARVIGSAGSPAKVELLERKLGFDKAFDYRDGELYRQLSAAAPDGIDVYFDNVGGDHLEAAIGVLNDHGRVALCGSISAYNAEQAPPGPRNLGLAVGKRLSLRGFIVTDHATRFAAMAEEIGGWLADGSLIAEETVRDGGLDTAVPAFLAMLRGENQGKMIVHFD